MLRRLIFTLQCVSLHPYLAQTHLVRKAGSKLENEFMFNLVRNVHLSLQVSFEVQKFGNTLGRLGVGDISLPSPQSNYNVSLYLKPGKAEKKPPIKLKTLD